MNKGQLKAIEGVSLELWRTMYVEMLRIRRTEERLADLISKGEIKCPVHLCIGQEAVAVGICKALGKEDYIFGNHRSHGHYLAKGGDLKQLMAEALGKKTGCSKGRGGSMHLVAPEVGLMGTSSMVASGIPHAVGAAMAFSMQGTKRIAVSFFGDGAADEGVFHESLNLAALRKAPVIFVCENNLYSSHLHIRERRPADNILNIARANCISAICVDGNDVLAVYQAAKRAVDAARKGEGPTFIECRTYRWRGHVGPNYDIDKGLRSKEELSRWMARCPVKSLEAHLVNERLLTKTDINTLCKKVEEEISLALAFARRSPMPDKAELANNTFKSKDTNHV